MTDRRVTGSKPARAVEPGDGPTGPAHRPRSASPLAARLNRPHSRDEAEERYVAARDAWTAAMKASASGRSSDLAALATVQEAYEAALAERERWASGPAVAIPVQPDRPSGIDIVVGQELNWRRVHEHELERGQTEKAGKGVLRRLLRR